MTEQSGRLPSQELFEPTAKVAMRPSRAWVEGIINALETLPGKTFREMWNDGYYHFVLDDERCELIVQYDVSSQTVSARIRLNKDEVISTRNYGESDHYKVLSIGTVERIETLPTEPQSIRISGGEDFIQVDRDGLVQSQITFKQSNYRTNGRTARTNRSYIMSYKRQ